MITKMNHTLFGLEKGSATGVGAMVPHRRTTQRISNPAEGRGENARIVLLIRYVLLVTITYGTQAGKLTKRNTSSAKNIIRGILGRGRSD